MICSAVEIFSTNYTSITSCTGHFISHKDPEINVEV